MCDPDPPVVPLDVELGVCTTAPGKGKLVGVLAFARGEVGLTELGLLKAVLDVLLVYEMEM
jgi:hypothetical protein